MSDDVKVTEGKLSDFQPDTKNANKGTERGRYALETSVDEVGFGRPMVADAKQRMVAGNKTQEVLIQAGMENAIIVHSDGTRPIIHVRDDWDLEDEDPNNPARRYAYWDNRTNEVGFQIDPEQVKVDLAAGFDFSAMFHEFELDIILEPPPPPMEAPEEFPEYDEDINTDYCCPKCGYSWSGSPT